MILVIKNGARLCCDNRWREFANFGTYPSCVKVYKSVGFAKRRARYNGGGVAVIPPGAVVDAVGGVALSADASVTARVEDYVIDEPYVSSMTSSLALRQNA